MAVDTENRFHHKSAANSDFQDIAGLPFHRPDCTFALTKAGQHSF